MLSRSEWLFCVGISQSSHALNGRIDANAPAPSSACMHACPLPADDATAQCTHRFRLYACNQHVPRLICCPIRFAAAEQMAHLRRAPRARRTRGGPINYGVANCALIWLSRPRGPRDRSVGGRTGNCDWADWGWRGGGGGWRGGGGKRTLFRCVPGARWRTKRLRHKIIVINIRAREPNLVKLYKLAR